MPISLAWYDDATLSLSYQEFDAVDYARHEHNLDKKIGDSAPRNFVYRSS